MTDQNPVKFTTGYHFARAYMMDAAKRSKMTFDPNDNYKEDMDDYYLPQVFTAVKQLMEAQTSELDGYSVRNAPRINTDAMFRKYCIYCVCKRKFAKGYSPLHFLHAMSWITYMAFHLNEVYSRHYLLDAMYIIGDILDCYLENGEFESQGGWSEFYDVAELMDENMIENYLYSLGKRRK